jgi:hypothetical protein
MNVYAREPFDTSIRNSPPRTPGAAFFPALDAEIDVRSFIIANVTPYEGDAASSPASRRAPPTFGRS